MYIAIIMWKSLMVDGSLIEYDSVKFFNDDVKGFKNIRWAVLYEKKTGKEVKRYPNQAIHSDSEERCECADHQGGPCSFCMEAKYNL